MVIKLYVSNNSGNKTIKHHQEQIKLILDCKKVEYEEVDISAPDQGDEKTLMQETCKKKEGQRVPLPPQVFNESEYLGDFDDFILANDDDEIWSFLKLEPQEPQPEAFTYTQERMNGYTNGHVNGDDYIVLNGQPTDWTNGLENGHEEEEIHEHVEMEPETVVDEIKESEILQQFTEIHEQESTEIQGQQFTDIQEEESTEIHEQQFTDIQEEESTEVHEQQFTEIHEQESTEVQEQESTEIQGQGSTEVQESLWEEMQESVEEDIHGSVEKVVETVERETTEEQLVSDE